jgi:hypothetical protein
MGIEAPYMGFWRYGISKPVNASFEPKLPTWFTTELSEAKWQMGLDTP